MIDSHAHYDDEQFDTDREKLLTNLFSGTVAKHSIDAIINASCDMNSLQTSLNLTKRYDKLYTAIGIHPENTEGVPSSYLDTFETLLNDKKVVAIGEIGLDYHRDIVDKDTQKRFFNQQLAFAYENNMPVVIHDRDAHGDCVSEVLKYKNLRGIFHSFSGSVETAAVLMKAGFYISFGGVCTFTNAKNIVNVVKIVPDDLLLTETDCPYLSPHPLRGKRNCSSNIDLIIDKLAEIRGTTANYINDITTANARRLFNI